MKKNNYKWLFLLLAAMFVGCSSDDNGNVVAEEEITSGTADFTTYVALGNSLTSGYSDGALFMAGQQNSIPNILAQRFALAGGGEFIQPMVTGNTGGLLFMGNVIQQPRLFFNGAGPERLSVMPTTEVTTALSGSFNNMGVPGAKSFHLLAPGYGNVAGVPLGQANPYFARFASSPETTILNDALAQEPTFFSLWIGNNDVLNYATSGGTGENQQGNFDPSTYANNDLSDPTVFAQTYQGIVTALTANGAKGVLANIPNIIKAPYFTTVPYNPLNPANPAFGDLIPLLNQTFGGLNQVFAALGVPERSIVFTETAANAVIIKDESLTDISAQISGALIQGGLDPGTALLFGMLYGQARPANEDDLLVLPSSNILGQPNPDAIAMLIDFGVPMETAGQLAVNGITFPLEDRWVLIPSEQQDIIEATEAYNEIIRNAAEDKDLAFVDVSSILNQVAEGGVQFDEFSLNAKLVFGGAFSLDGIHPSARGYAYLANRFLEAINATYGSNLPPVKAADYNTLYPTSF